MNGPRPGAPLAAGLAFTAFGERLGTWSGDGAALPRYGYAGTWGYQDDSLADPGVFYAPLLHVGARWYDPALGRFLQRDPIGIAGGVNVYAYTVNAPTHLIDLTGYGPTLVSTTTATDIGLTLGGIIYGGFRNMGWSPTGNPFLDSALDLAVSGLAGSALGRLSKAAMPACLRGPTFPRPPLIPDPPSGGPPGWPPGPFPPVR